jgi:hypothetical protein
MGDVRLKISFARATNLTFYQPQPPPFSETKRFFQASCFFPRSTSTQPAEKGPTMTKVSAIDERIAALALSLDNRIAARAAQDSNLQCEEHDDSTTQSGLLKLPPEICNYIFELACWHSESEGVIAPALPSHGQLSSQKAPKDVIAFVKGHVRNLSDQQTIQTIYDDLKKKVMQLETWDGPVQSVDQVSPQTISKFIPSGMYDQVLVRVHQHVISGGSMRDYVTRDCLNPGETREHLRVYGPWEIVHVCSLGCLQQPAVTCVSRQLRQESLPIFYGTNRFHFFWSFTSSSNIQRGFVLWWRRVGDTNLRLIKQFELCSHPYGGTPETVQVVRKAAADFQVKIKFKHNDTETTVHANMGKEAENAASMRSELSFEEKDREDKEFLHRFRVVAEYGGYIQAQGLFVRGLEKVLHHFEALDAVMY